MRFLPVALAVMLLSGCGTDAVRLVTSAESHLAAGRDREAAIELRNVIALEPDHPRANFLLGKLLAKVGSLVDAEIVLVRALKAGYSAAEVVPVLGDVLLEAEKYSVVIQTFEAIETGGDPEFAARLALLRGQAHAGLGKLLDARTQLALATPIFPAESRVVLAELLAASGDLAGAERELRAITADHPRSEHAWVALGMHLRRLDRDGDAIAAFRAALDIAPQNTVALLGQAIVHLTRDDLPAARPYLEQAGRIAPLKPMLEFANGLLALKEKRHEDARAALQRLLDAVPTYRPALLLAGALNYATERYDLAENSYTAYLRFDPNNSFARKMLGATLIAKGRPDAALEVLAPVTSQARDPELLILAGRASLSLGRVQSARRALQQATKVAPESADARLHLAYVEMIAGRRASAATEFEAAIRLRPDDPRASRGYCMMLLADGRIDRAAAVALALLDRAPGSAEAHTLVGAVELARKDDAAARARFERALDIAPNFIPAAEALADIDRRAGVPDALKKRMDAVIVADPRNLDALLIRARIEMDAGGGEQSAGRIRELLTQHPRSLRALLLLAESQLRSGQAAEAIATARRASEEHPWDTQSLYVLADAQLASGDPSAAIVTLERVSAMAPRTMEPRLRIAMALVRSGDLTTAASRLNAILRADTRNVPARLLLGQVHIATKRIDDAFSIASELQAAAPRHYAGYRLEGEAALASGAADRAVRAFAAAESLAPSGEHKVQLHRARTIAAGKVASLDELQQWIDRFPADREVRMYLADNLLLDRRFEDAAGQYQYMLKRFGPDAHVLNNLAWSELELRRDDGLKRALEYARKAAELRPEEARILDTLGVVLLRSSQAAAAVQVLLQAHSKDASDPEIRLHLAEALLQVGDSSRAHKELAHLTGRNDVPKELRERAVSLAGQLQAPVR
jgi:putative PEP-CTERM system TPR-repeat lipoprotein